MKYIVHTYGCQMNYSDSERIEYYLESLGYEKTSSDLRADIIVLNTCAIRQKAEDRISGIMPRLGQLKTQNPELKIVLTGCMVRLSSNKFSQKKDKFLRILPDIDICLKIDELPRFAELIRECSNNEFHKIDEELLDHYFKIQASYKQSPKNQAFIPVSMGCDKFCTYCIVPFSRGREKSRPIADILMEAEKVAEMGYKEITLVGQTVNSYGVSAYDKIHGQIGEIPSGKEPFVYLLEKMDKLQSLGIERVRWTSPHPKDMTSQLIDAMAGLKTQMPSIHLPVQSGDDRTLKRMNRPYSVDRYKEIVLELRKKIPGISISTDFIVGFSGETDDEFMNTCEFFKEMKFEFAFLSQYSVRPGTFASKRLVDDIPVSVKKKRWNHLNDILREQSLNSLSRFVGQKPRVLFERIDKNAIYGKTEHFREVKIEMQKPDKSLIGQIIPVEIVQAREWELIGEF